MLASFRFKRVEREVLQHPIERRGFVQVPFDYANPAGDKIEIFFRLIPTLGSTPADSTKPIVVVMNGGPGLPSNFYRSMDFDYSNPESPKNGPFDRFKFLLKTHRILLVDQRGTDGCSAPLDMDHPGNDAHLIARYFSSDSVARDHQAVIEKVIPPGEPFYIIAQSYGGMPGMQYLSLPDARRPSGIVFSCSALPDRNVFEQWLIRRQEQLSLNLQLRRAFPDIDQRLEAVKSHCVKVGLDAARVHGLYYWLGKGLPGAWEKALVEHLDKMMKQSREEIETDPSGKLGQVILLNYVLSACAMDLGQTDRQLARLALEKLPFEAWMIDENQMILAEGRDGSWRGPWMDEFDSNPPPPTPIAPLEELRSAISRNQLLFMAGDNDAFVPAEVFLKSAQNFLVKGHTEVVRVPGGHNAVFMEDGYSAFLEWSKKTRR